MGQAALQSATSLNVENALHSALDGRGISREQAVLLIEHAETGDLLFAASSLRQKFKGNIVSYSRKVFIPLTHLCRDYCGYCTFRADPSPHRPALYDSGRGSGGRATRRACRLQGGAVQSRRSAGTDFRGSSEFPSAARPFTHARLSRGHDGTRAGKDRIASAFQSGADGRGRSGPSARQQCQSRFDAGIDEHEVAPKRCCALACARQGACAAVARD